MSETKNIAPRPKARAGYAPDLPPLDAAAAEAEPAAERVFQMPEAQLPADLGRTPAPPIPRSAELDRRYAARQYTVDAVSPRGFPVHLTFADISIRELDGHIGKLAELGYTPPAAPAPAAAPVATPDDLPEGWKLCQKHGAPMRPRNKQNQDWHSHNVGTKENPLWCKGYRGSDSPGYDVD